MANKGQNQLKIRLATRGSPLALWQAHHVSGLLQSKGIQSELVLVQTRGDQVQDKPLSQIGGDGLFTREVQHAVLDGRADVAVHSLKDLPTLQDSRLSLAAIPKRGPRGDVWLSPQFGQFQELPKGSVIATGSLRRRAQMLHQRPDLKMVGLRGNLGTRLGILEKGKTPDGSCNLHGMVLAEAGLVRLQLGSHIRHARDPSWMLPAVGQGALGLECRANDSTTMTILAQLNDAETRCEVLAERRMLAALGGGCLIPIGCLAMIENGVLLLRAAVLDPDGKRRIAAENQGPDSSPEKLGEELANILMSQGAGELLSQIPLTQSLEATP